MLGGGVEESGGVEVCALRVEEEGVANHFVRCVCVFVRGCLGVGRGRCGCGYVPVCEVCILVKRQCERLQFELGLHHAVKQGEEVHRRLLHIRALAFFQLAHAVRMDGDVGVKCVRACSFGEVLPNEVGGGEGGGEEREKEKKRERERKGER